MKILRDLGSFHMNSLGFFMGQSAQVTSKKRSERVISLALGLLLGHPSSKRISVFERVKSGSPIGINKINFLC